MNNAAGERQFDRPENNVKLYVMIAKLPEMILGETAPPSPPLQHKSHINHLHVKPEPYRRRFAALISCRSMPEYDQSVRTFTQRRLPCLPLDIPTQDPRTGAAFTIPIRGLNLNIAQPFLPRPNTIEDMMPWFYTYPFQTLTRTMQVAFPAKAADWSITPLPFEDVDRLIWQTYAWRKTPPPSNLETYYRVPQNPISECTMIICAQPPWVLSEADIDSFKNVGSFPTYNEEGNNRPYRSAHRMWAKLWDICVRAKCRFWVLTTYHRWIFGSFSESFRAGHIFTIKSYISTNPTVLQTLVFHTAKSMGLADDIYIPGYFDSTDDQDDPPDDLPYLPDYPGMDFANSESEWEGMDEDVATSAGVSDYLDSRVSAHGSAANIELPIVRVFRANANRHPLRIPARRRRSTSTPPVAGPSRLGPALLRARRDSISSRSTASPPLAGVEHVEADSAPAEPIKEYWGISRATAEVTTSIMEWHDNIETDDEAVEELLNGDVDENVITHSLAIEPIYLAALQSVNQNGGNSLSIPNPPTQTIHHHEPVRTGGYMNVIPELGSIREVEETQEAEYQTQKDEERETLWREYTTVGRPVDGGTDEDNAHDMLGRDSVVPPASRA